VTETAHIKRQLKGKNGKMPEKNGRELVTR